MTTTLAGRRALVTGAAKGIGRSVAEHLATIDMRLVLLDVDPGVTEVADRLGATSIVADLTASDDVRGQLAALADDEAFWLLVNNAGVFFRSSILDMEIDDWDRVQQINVRSMVTTMQAVVPAMIAAGGGRVVNMASMAAKLGTPGEAAYAASKSAVVALSRIASMEFGEHDITVNSICPGYVLTEMGADTRSPQDVAAWTAKSPLGRLASEGDVASLIAHLASDGAGYLTGQALNVTGGMCTW
ncbi:SDR family NAD(P)-dependent oxidoreductase [Ilumatobacter coccineus]|uniref:Putative oxidoreductase n=1 Tax=Ilumatobacter coccineus (strain NBRC 103263 / KCTC 29153 / YM16-304) TaxID=1313172 RepID=A0A6C7EEE2_ILUCY|nr:SDR family NAD(P)-dependent oxidoreductase [Ilumatobacter coccineus]BAN04312.1 putative oxidoreductase [Ilumatobacter coccineus YM16-304]